MCGSKTLCVMLLQISKMTREKKALFLNLAGDNLVQIFDSLSFTDTLNYINTVKLLTEHFAPCKTFTICHFYIQEMQKTRYRIINFILFDVEKPFSELRVLWEFRQRANISKNNNNTVYSELTIYYYYLFKF